MKNINIPDKVLGKLEKYSKQFGIRTEDLKSELVEFIPDIKAEFPKFKEKQQMVLALRKLTGRLVKEEGGTRSTAVIHTGFFLGETGTKDTANAMIKKIMRMTPEEQREFHPKPTVWLDYREAHFKEPIESLKHRTLYGVGSSGGEIASERTKFVKLELWRELVKTVTPESLGELYTFRAIPKKTDRQLPNYELNGSQYTRLRKAPTQLTDEEKEKLVRNCGKTIFNISDLPHLYETRFKRVPGKPANWNVDPVFVEADVSSIAIRETKQNIINIHDESEEGIVKAVAFMPHYLPIKFKDFDRVIFLGDIGQVTMGGETQETLFIKGYFTVPMTSLADEYV